MGPPRIGCGGPRVCRAAFDHFPIHQLVWDALRQEWRWADMWTERFYLPDLPRPGWVVASRFEAGRKPRQLLTNEALETW